MSFENKTVIITGAGSGIGAQTAKQFVAHGANVVLNGRSAENLQTVANTIDPAGSKTLVHAGDISQVSTSKSLVAATTERFGGVDVLVNNAGIFAPKPFLEQTEEEYDRFVDIILKGKFFLAQEAAKAMQKRGGGAIVQTGSMWALQAIGATPSAAYSAANAGVHQLVKNLALELADSHIRINAVAPAVVETPVYNTFMSDDEVAETLPGFNAFHPLGRNGQPQDIADAILFLASDQASWITGTVLPVDGGVMAGRN